MKIDRINVDALAKEAESVLGENWDDFYYDYLCESSEFNILYADMTPQEISETLIEAGVNFHKHGKVDHITGVGNKDLEWFFNCSEETFMEGFRYNLENERVRKEAQEFEGVSIRTTKCECGSEAAGTDGHSGWCPKSG